MDVGVGDAVGEAVDVVVVVEGKPGKGGVAVEGGQIVLE